MTSCYFVWNQGGWCETRGSFATRAGAATQFGFPEACCCGGIYLTVGVKQHCVLWAGFECCVTMLPSHSGKLERCRGIPRRDRCRQSVGVSFLPTLSLGECSILSGMERLASYPEQQMWLQKWNTFLIVVLSSLSFWTSSLLLS